MGLFYEDFTPGRRFETGFREVTAADVDAFAALTGDAQPLHTDDAAARAAGFEGRVAHGVLGLALATGLVSGLGLTHGTLVALAGIEWRFVAAIAPGDRVAVQLEVASRRTTSRAERGLVILRVVMVNHRGVTVQDGTWTELVRRRGEGSIED